MAPVAGTNRVDRTPVNPIHPPDEKKVIPPQRQTNVIDSASRLTRLSDLRLSGTMQKFRLQNLQPQQPPQPPPTPPNQPDKAVDGYLLGADGPVPPNTPLRDVNAVVPQGGVRNNETLIYTNGILTNTEAQAGSLQAIADQTGSRVIGVRNATENILVDSDQTLNDKLGIGNNPAVDTLADTVYSELRAGGSPHLIAHSQGAAITSRALTDVKNRLTAEDGMSRQDAERLLSNVRVETFGGAARRYPDGPQYVHYLNRNDGVPMALGVRDWLNPLARPGKGAVTHFFEAGKPFISHGFEDFYLPRRVPFEEARQGKFKEPEALSILDKVKNFAVDAKNIVTEKAVQAKDFAVEKAVQAKDFVVEKVVQSKDFAVRKFNEGKDFIGRKFNEAKNFIGTKFNQAKAIAGVGLAAAKDYAANKLNQAKTIAEVGFDLLFGRR